MKQEVPQGWLILKIDDLKDAIEECFEAGRPGCFLTYHKEMCEYDIPESKYSALCKICSMIVKEGKVRYLPGEDEILYHLGRGIIAGLSGHPMSGLWTLVFMDGTQVHVTSGYGVRNLASCFGATKGKGDLQDKIRNQDVYYGIDALGVLEWFLPVNEWEGKELLVGEEIWLPETEFPRNETSIE